MSKIMNVYYGTDTLPYKDKECQVHFPIIGQTFAGSSLVDTIKFYVGKIGGIADIEWLGIVKRADGSIAYQELESSSDSDGVFVTLPLASYYTEKKGDLYITLNGYQGGVTITQDENDIWHVVGTPIVQVAGAVKLTIAYAPVLPQNAGALETITVQEALGLVASKLDKDSPYYMKVVSVSNINDINTGIYGQYLQNGDIFYEKNGRTFYKIVSGEFGTFVVQEIEFVLNSLQVDELNMTGSITIPDSFNDIWCEATDSGLQDYIDNGLSLKANASETYTKTETNTLLSAKADKSDTYTRTQVDDAIASAVASAYKYKGSVASYDNLPTSGNEVGDVYNVEDTGDNYAWTGTTWDKLAGTIDLSAYATLTDLQNGLATKQSTINSVNKLSSDLVDDTNQTNKFVTTSEKSTWNAKQDELVSGTNIKTINGDSILGKGNLVIDLSDEYAKVDGNYPTLTSGQALSIYSDREISDADQACPPITFGTAGGNAEIQNGYQKLEEIRGNTVKWNQCLNLTGQPTSDTPDGLTFNRDNSGLATVSGTATASGSTGFIPSVIVSQSKPLITGHKYLLKLHLKGDIGTAKFACSGLANTIRKDGIYTAIAGGTMYGQFWYVEGETYDISYKPEIFDLTDIYGAGNEPESVVEFNRTYPKSGYGFNAGQLLSSKSSALESIGMNQYQALDTYIEVIAGEKYHISGISAGGYIEEYDGAKNLIKTSEEITSTTIVELDANTHFVKVQATTYTDIMLRLYCDTPNVPYKPYEKQTIVLPDIELRSAGNVYDVIYPSGGGKRRIEYVNIIDMINAQYRLIDTDNGSGKQIVFYAGYGYLLTHPIKPAVTSTTKGNILTTLYETVSNNTSYNQTSSGTTRTMDNFVSVGSTGFISIVSHDFDNLSSKQDLIDYFTTNPCYIQYELETEEDIISDPFTELVKVDNYGTLKFVSSQAVQIPQAYFIRYTVSLTEWLDSAYAYTDGTPDKLALKSYVDTAISQIPTGDFGFPLITAPSSTSLSADEITSITSGCVVNGTFLGIANPVFFKAVEIWGIYFGLVIGVVENNRQPLIQSYQIQNGTIALRADTQQVLDIHNVNSINGKNIPAYPSSTGTFVLKCVNGVLTWVAE